MRLQLEVLPFLLHSGTAETVNYKRIHLHILYSHMCNSSISLYTVNITELQQYLIDIFNGLCPELPSRQAATGTNGLLLILTYYHQNPLEVILC